MLNWNVKVELEREREFNGVEHLLFFKGPKFGYLHTHDISNPPVIPVLWDLMNSLCAWDVPGTNINMPTNTHMHKKFFFWSEGKR